MVQSVNRPERSICSFHFYMDGYALENCNTFGGLNLYDLKITEKSFRINVFLYAHFILIWQIIFVMAVDKKQDRYGPVSRLL